MAEMEWAACPMERCLEERASAIGSAKHGEEKMAVGGKSKH
jgi:hypothetical protein